MICRVLVIFAVCLSLSGCMSSLAPSGHSFDIVVYGPDGVPARTFFNARDIQVMHGSSPARYIIDEHGVEHMTTAPVMVSPSPVNQP